MVRFIRFHRLHPAHRDLTFELLHASEHGPPFLRFMLLWMSFNGWMACVTDQRSDRLMLHDLLPHPRLLLSFRDLVEQDQDFRGTVTEFSTWWPIFDPRSARRHLGRRVYDYYDRNEFLDVVGSDPRVVRSPETWVRGDEVRWPDLLMTIYRIRCNLFHGEKSPANAADEALVGCSYETLNRFVRATNLYEWHD